MTRTIIIVLSSLITVAAVLPYIIDVIKLKTKPRVVSWFIWAVLASVAAAASLSNGQIAAFVLSASGAIECFTIAFLGWSRGNKDYNALDISCLLGAVVGLLLWYMFNSPSVAIIAVIIIDLIGSLPTIKHAWQKPLEETWITFALSGLAAAFAMSAATSIRITSWANPVYLVLINLTITLIILTRSKLIRVQIPPSNGL